MSSSTSGPLRLAEEYLVRGDVKEALGIYQRISETEPSNLTIKSRLGELCALANQNSEAVRVLADVARSHIRDGHNTDAVAALTKVLKLKLSDPDLLMDIAGLCGRSGLNADAERCYLEAANIYAGAGETVKLEAAYEMAAAVGPASAELLMNLGAVCHRTGKLADSYRAFMKAAAEFNRRGDDSAALDAYGKALKVAPSGAEAGNAVAEVMKHLGLGENPGAAGRPRTAERPALPLQFPHAATSAEPPYATRLDGIRPVSKPDATDDELLVGKISKAELLFGFGRFDQAIALLKELVDLKPNDARVYRKLKDIYLRSEMPAEAAEAYRELARIYKAEGDEELAADCAASARRLCGLPADPSAEDPVATPTQPSVVWQPIARPKEPDLTLITPALPASPPVRYTPTRQRAETSATEVNSEDGSQPEVAQHSPTQSPVIVLSTPTVSPVQISTPPLRADAGQLNEPTEEVGDASREDKPASELVLEAEQDDVAPPNSSSGGHNRQAASTPIPLPKSPTPIRPAGRPVQTATGPRPAPVRVKSVPEPATVTASSSTSTLFGVQLDGSADTSVAGTGKRRYWIAAVIAVVVLSGSGGGYFLVRRNQLRNNVAAQTIEAQPDAVATESPSPDAPLEVNAVPADSAAERTEKEPETASSPVKKTPDQPVQRPTPYQTAAVATATPYAPPVVQRTQQPRPTPPPVLGPVSAGPGTMGGPSVSPGALTRDLPAAPPPPTPGPTARRAAVMAGGELLRRVEPIYPQAARSAHITGTVTVELGINEQGNVISARAISGPGMLAGSAESAARGFKFKPITLDGVPVKSNRTILFHFKE